MSQPNPDRARYVMIGGFLGAGKTTAVARFAQRLTDEGKRVGLISNDQSRGLVDTAKGFEILGVTVGKIQVEQNDIRLAATD